jgi:hypothetical protein
VPVDDIEPAQDLYGNCSDEGIIRSAIIALDRASKVGERDTSLTKHELDDIAVSSGVHALVCQLRQWEIEESSIIAILSFRKRNINVIIGYIKKRCDSDFVFLGIE